MRLIDMVEAVSGTPQFRINESVSEGSQVYFSYSQTDLQDDMAGIISSEVESKKIRTRDNVNILNAFDVVFSLISGNAVVVRKEHEGYLYTQNYIKLIPGESIDSKYLAYYLNENKDIRRQLYLGLQGSAVMKYTLKQLKELEMNILLPLEKQKIIGEVYFKQLRLEALKARVAKSETTLVLHQLEEEIINE